jgi:flagellar assembly factor FliW
MSPTVTVTAPAPPIVQPIVFPAGLIGCDQWRQFVLLTDDEEDLPVAYLQSVDEPSVRLLVTDPHLLMDAYTVELSDEDRANLELASSENAVLYCTLTVHDNGEITANLLGPLAINARTRIGQQVVLSDSTYSTRHFVTQLEVA